MKAYFFSDGVLEWTCGGALINNHYIVTAAHCVHPDFTYANKLEKIRLGEHNLNQNPDCVDVEGKKVCSAPVEEYTSQEVTIHPNFTRRGVYETVSDDIALIRLDREVVFSETIHPICLPAVDEKPPQLATVAGWGSTEDGQDENILQQASLPHVCYGGGGRRDSCYGDSGCPVFYPRVTQGTTNVLTGIVSFGKSLCGIEGVPAVYTRVAAYRQWIISKLAP
ncbi:Serine protease grass-like [Homarus americanus]|uniref:Serine protease grass-like n=1 Tax=Homarus americanus TaxID=6706 RepID=A0A8J5N8H7_HOMAM|nr:Serine protease grass-like [Homarus americanus]